MLIKLLVSPSFGKSTNEYQLLKCLIDRGLAISGLTFGPDYRLSSSGANAVKAADLYEQIVTLVPAACTWVWTTPRGIWCNLMKPALDRLQVISILSEQGRGRVAHRFHGRAFAPEFLEWAKSTVETGASKTGNRLVPLRTVPKEHPAQARSAAVTVQVHNMVHLAKREYPSLPNKLHPPIINALTARQSSVPLLSLQTEPCL